ncbi:N-acetyltransferase [Shewanella youngdeokensis]|uniref:N-acetyltransferase n=1 Tax=Shewanella youngdeokensis TaxID=2999068 RepID=A0ABZ0K494_9GAMM|nr:N-acetyltransferase [Shewanella sp. DAU334]
MIRSYKNDDIEAVLKLWLTASIKAHDFVDAEFWQSQVDNMRNIYLPASDIFVYQRGSKIIGFYALYETTLAALFVANDAQGQGVGKQLLSHAKSQRTRLSLCVYKENEPSIKFYMSQGFSIISEQTDKHTGHQELTMTHEPKP